jgi:hypothetical protein
VPGLSLHFLYLVVYSEVPLFTDEVQ